MAAFLLFIRMEFPTLTPTPGAAINVSKNLHQALKGKSGNPEIVAIIQNGF